MAEFVKVLESVISIRDIRKVATEYDGSINGSNKRIHYLWVEYYDGTKYEYRTTDIEKARQDYERLKNALLELKDGERREGE